MIILYFYVIFAPLHSTVSCSCVCLNHGFAPVFTYRSPVLLRVIVQHSSGALLVKAQVRLTVKKVWIQQNTSVYLILFLVSDQMFKDETQSCFLFRCYD